MMVIGEHYLYSSNIKANNFAKNFQNWKLFDNLCNSKTNESSNKDLKNF